MNPNEENYQTLYSRTTTGKVQTWWAEISDEDPSQYRTVSGQLDGTLVYSGWITAEGKNYGKRNELSPEAQAEKEVEALYRKKLKEKYHERLEDIDSQKFFQPMLAKNYKDRKSKVKFELGEWIAQTKYNGMRCIASKAGLFSRKGERILTCTHIEEALAPIFSADPTLILDGELFNESLRQKLNELISLTRKTKNILPEDYEAARKIVGYYIYDNNLPEHYAKRYERLKEIAQASPYVFLADYEAIFSEHDLTQFFDSRIEHGHEGVILRYLHAPYEHKRSANLLKYKPTDTDEVLVVGIYEGEGHWAGKAKIITVRDSKGQTFNATFKGSMEQAEEVLANYYDYLNTTITIHYFGLTGLGTPNSAQWDYNNYLRND